MRMNLHCRYLLSLLIWPLLALAIVLLIFDGEWSVSFQYAMQNKAYILIEFFVGVLSIYFLAIVCSSAWLWSVVALVTAVAVTKSLVNLELKWRVVAHVLTGVLALGPFILLASGVLK